MMPPDFFALEVCFVTNALICLDAPWQDAAKLRLPTELAGWILEPASLTARLKRHCVDFRVQLLNEAPAEIPLFLRPLLPDARHGQVREVILWCDDLPCVYAQSWLPQHTINTLRPLADLGERPLGDYIFQQPGLTRGTIEAAELDMAAAALDAVQSAQRCFARRSVFRLTGLPFLVAEVFLPATLQLQERS